MNINLMPVERTLRSWKRGDTEVRLSTQNGLNRLRVFVDGTRRHSGAFVPGLLMLWCHCGHVRWKFGLRGLATPQLLEAVASASAWLAQPDLFASPLVKPALPVPGDSKADVTAEGAAP